MLGPATILGAVFSFYEYLITERFDGRRAPPVAASGRPRSGGTRGDQDGAGRCHRAVPEGRAGLHMPAICPAA